VAARRGKIDDECSYLEMLVSVIVDHEKNLNDLILRLESIVEKISEIIDDSPSRIIPKQ